MVRILPSFSTRRMRLRALDSVMKRNTEGAQLIAPNPRQRQRDNNATQIELEHRRDVIVAHRNRDLGDNAAFPSPSAAVKGCIMLQTVFDRLVVLTVLLPRSCIGSPYVARVNGDCRADAGWAASAEGDHEGWY